MPFAAKKSRKTQRARAATLADVGREAGVSAMAASAVLNGARTSSRISEKTRKRILKAATKLSYRPNFAARALASRRMHTIGVAAVIEEGELNHYFLEVFNGILGAAAHHGQNTTVFSLRNWHADAVRLQTFCDGRIDGLILLAPTCERGEVLLPPHIPYVSIHSNTRLQGVVNIESDEEHGALAMVTLLIAHGHRRIMHLAGPPGLIGTVRRLKAYKHALAAARIPYSSDLLLTAGYSQEEARRVMGDWLASHTGRPLPQAIFCANDAVALGCMEALAKAGIRVPDDVSVAGFDDTLGARMSIPQLSSVRQPLRAMGERAVELLLANMDHKAERRPESVVFPVDIVKRTSVATPPATTRKGR